MTPVSQLRSLPVSLMTPVNQLSSLPLHKHFAMQLHLAKILGLGDGIQSEALRSTISLFPENFVIN